ncbi:MAG: mechanosensitive ion channel [Saprospiraceae bacterium]|nr:mechanosensitive ion channel [Lewinella sp.]
MNELTSWPEIFLESLNVLSRQFISVIPGIIGAIVILLLGWLFARLIAAGITRVLILVKFDKLAENIRVDQYLQKANIQLSASSLVGKFFYYILLLLIIMTAADTMGWHAVSDEISSLISLLPNLMVAVIFFVVGMHIASFIRDLIRSTTQSLGIGIGKLVSAFVFYLLVAIVTLTALEQAGVDTKVITSNLLLIMGAILGAAAISYGIASKDLLANILAGFFSRRTFKIGQIIQIDNITGKIIEQSNICVIIQIDMDEKVVIPTHELITKKVRIIS